VRHVRGERKNREGIRYRVCGKAGKSVGEGRAST
jgi:hypothetical protein